MFIAKICHFTFSPRGPTLSQRRAYDKCYSWLHWDNQSWCAHRHALLPYRASQNTSSAVCRGCILKECCKHHMQTICLLHYSQKCWIPIPMLLNNSPVLPLFFRCFICNMRQKRKTATNGNSWALQSFQYFFLKLTLQSIWCRKATTQPEKVILWVRHRRTLYMGTSGKDTEGFVWLRRATETNNKNKICWFVWSCSLNDRENFRIEAPSYCFTVLKSSLLSHPCNWEPEKHHATRKILCLCFRTVGHVLHSYQYKIQYVAPPSQPSWPSSTKHCPQQANDKFHFWEIMDYR